jgi:hypothetical protein
LQNKSPSLEVALMRRRLVLIAAGITAMFGGGALLAAPVANALVVHVPSDPGPVGLLRLCVIASAADAGLCLHV